MFEHALGDISACQLPLLSHIISQLMIEDTGDNPGATGIIEDDKRSVWAGLGVGDDTAPVDEGFCKRPSDLTPSFIVGDKGIALKESIPVLLQSHVVASWKRLGEGPRREGIETNLKSM